MKFWRLLLFHSATVSAEWKFNRWQITEPRSGWQVDRPRLSPGRLQTDPRRDDVDFSLGENPYFSVSKDGDVYLSAPIDREETPFISLEIFAKDKSGSDVEPPSTIEIFVDDINDNAPIFPESSYEFSVPEMSPKGTPVGKVVAEDADASDGYGTGYGDIAYFLDSPFFRIDKYNGNIYVKKENLNREESTEYTVTVTAIDGGGVSTTGANEASVKVLVKITDINDNGPKFLPTIDEISFPEVPEDPQLGFDEFCFKVEDLDVGKNGDVEFRINSPGDKFFYIKAIKDSSAPAEKTIIDACLAPKEGKLDYETQNIHQLSIVAKNTRPLVSSAAKAGIIPSDSINFTVKVLNVNEPPQFKEDLSIFEISENADPGTRLCLRNDDKAGCKSVLRAVDPEGDAFEYKIDPEAIRNNFPFNIDATSGQLTLQSTVDRESKSTWEFDVLAVNTVDFDALTGRTRVRVLIKDVDDMPPNPQDSVIYFCPGASLSQWPITFTDPDESTDNSITAQFDDEQESSVIKDMLKMMSLNTDGNTLQLKSDESPDTQLPFNLKIKFADVKKNTKSMYFQVKSCPSCQSENGTCIDEKKLIAPASVQPQLWLAILLAICCSLFALISFLIWNHNKSRKLGSEVAYLPSNIDDVRENVVMYDNEAGEAPCTDSQIGYQTVPLNKASRDPAIQDSRLCHTIDHRLKNASSTENFTGAPWDSRLLYKYEGSNSVLNSLSSLNSHLTERSLDLRNFAEGNKFGLVRQLFHSSVPGSLHRNVTIEMDSNENYHAMLH